MDVVIREDLGRVARPCMNRVKRRNALSSDLIESLLEHLRAIREDETIGAVILTGAGKAFCAGGDLAGGMGANGGFLDSHNNRAAFGQLLKALQDHPKPVIAAVNGDVVVDLDSRWLRPGGGRRAGSDGNSRDSSWVISTRDPGGAEKEYRPQAPHGDDPYGEKFGMARATELGIVNRVAAEGELEACALELAELAASRSPAILALGKAAFNAIEDMSFEQALAYMHTQLTLNLLTEDAMEGVAAFLQKRPPEWRGR